jgi:long-chain acyl-CoA synthetase
VPTEPPNAAYTVAGLLRRLVAEQPEAVMLVEGGTRRTWAEEYRRACQVAQACRRDGITPDSRVAFLDRNGLAYFDVLFGGALAGAVNVAVNWRLAPSEMEAIVDDSRARLLLVHEAYLPALAQMTGGMPGVERVVVLRESDSHEPYGDRRAVDYDDWLGEVEPTDPGHVAAADDVSMQLYTSGTTGLPKGVMLTNANLATAIGEAGHTFRIDADTVSLVAMPLFHIGGSGWALCGMSRGGRSVILREMDPGALLALVEAERITEAFLVPAVLMALLGAPSLPTTDLSSLRHLFYGASPIAEDVLVRCMQAFGCGLNQVYGMTETTGAITRPARRGPRPGRSAPRPAAFSRPAAPWGGAPGGRSRRRDGAGDGRGGRSLDPIGVQHGGLLAEGQGNRSHAVGRRLVAHR